MSCPPSRLMPQRHALSWPDTSALSEIGTACQNVQNILNTLNMSATTLLATARSAQEGSQRQAHETTREAAAADKGRRWGCHADR